MLEVAAFTTKGEREAIEANIRSAAPDIIDNKVVEWAETLWHELPGAQKMVKEREVGGNSRRVTVKSQQRQQIPHVAGGAARALLKENTAQSGKQSGRGEHDSAGKFARQFAAAK